MEPIEAVLAELMKGLARMEAAIRDHAARLNVLQVSTAFLLGGEHALEAMKTLDAQRQKFLHADSNALEPETIVAMIDALKRGSFGQS